MNFAGHFTGAILSGLGMSAYAINTGNAEHIMPIALTTVAAALYPDMDTRSTPRKFLTPIGIIACVISAISGNLPLAGLIALITFMPFMTSHRKFNHSIVWMLCLAGIMKYITGIDMVFASVCIGFMTHLILDKFYFRLI